MEDCTPITACRCGGRQDGTHEWWCDTRSTVATSAGSVLDSAGAAACARAVDVGQDRGVPRRTWTASSEDDGESIGAWREEQLDWLHAQHEEASRQTELLERISRHTALLYGIAIAWLVLFGLAIVVVFISAASGADPSRF